MTTIRLIKISFAGGPVIAKAFELPTANSTTCDGTGVNATAPYHHNATADATDLPSRARCGLDGQAAGCAQCDWGKCADTGAEDHPANGTAAARNARNATATAVPRVSEELDVLPDDDEEETRKELLKPFSNDDLELDAELERDLFRAFPHKRNGKETEEEHESLFAAAAALTAAAEVEHMLPSFAARNTRGDSAIFNASHAAAFNGTMAECVECAGPDGFASATASALAALRNSTEALLGAFPLGESQGLPATADMSAMFQNYYNSTAPNCGGSGRTVSEKLMNASLARTNGAYDDVYFGSNYFNNAPAVCGAGGPLAGGAAKCRPCAAGDDRTQCLEVLGEASEADEEHGWLQTKLETVSDRLGIACKHCQAGAIAAPAFVKKTAQQAVTSCKNCEAASALAALHLTSAAL